MKANTKKADEIHDYYIKLETVLQETIDDQTSELRNQLTNKDKEIKTVKTKLLSKHKEIATIEEENINLKKKMRERQRHRYTEGSSVYIIMNDDIKDKFKFGETKNINSRITGLNSGAPSQYYVHKMWHTRMAKKTEKVVHDIFGKYRISKDCEWFENKTLDKVIEFVDKIVSLYEDYDTVKVIKKAEIVQYAPLIFIDTNEKQCTECKLYQPLTSFFIQDNTVEELSKYDSEEHKQKIYSKRYRSKCKNCCSAYAKQHRKELRANPTVGKNECVSCKELLDYKSFFEGFEECISCYKKNRDLDGYYKQCNKCKDILQSSGFHSDINKEDKLHTMCKKCRNDKQKSNKNSDIVICEFCEKEVVGKFNLKSHQKTISCLQKQGLDVVKKVNKGKCRKIIQFSKDGLKIIKQYDSIIQAANDNEICRTAISKCLRGELKTAADFVWKYV